MFLMVFWMSSIFRIYDVLELGFLGFWCKDYIEFVLVDYCLLINILYNIRFFLEYLKFCLFVSMVSEI